MAKMIVLRKREDPAVTQPSNTARAAELEYRRRAVEVAVSRWERVKKLCADGSESTAAVEDAELALLRVKFELACVEELATNLPPAT